MSKPDENPRSVVSLSGTAVQARNCRNPATPASKGLLRAAGDAKDGVVLWTAVLEWGSIASGRTPASNPDNIFPTAVRLDLEAAVRLALEVEARAYQTEVHSSQVDQGAYQVD